MEDNQLDAFILGPEEVTVLDFSLEGCGDENIGEKCLLIEGGGEYHDVESARVYSSWLCYKSSSSFLSPHRFTRK
jgi:hypothetical protein